MITKLKHKDIPAIIEIMHQDGVRGYNGQFIDSENEWFIHFFDCQTCFIYGLFDEDLRAVLVAETMSNNGCMLWYIAVHPNHHRKGYGKRLLSFFEDLAKQNDIKWIYLAASIESLEFYKEMGYETAGIRLIEHVKNLEDKCPKCGEKQNLHTNYDYGKPDRPTIDILCNECGTFFR